MTNLERAFDLRNLRQAYRWILSNPDAGYKSYFRDAYDAFALASETHLRWIRQEVLKDRYSPSHASKILLPKPSGTLRPLTLLTVEDQIVYQACVNLIADALKRATRKRYETRVFAHLYAGRSSPFFYLRWQRSYQKFARKIRDAFSKGFGHIADFDLTSFYDSIDHHVLKHFLSALAIDEELIDFLLDGLRKWTSSTWSNGPENIYHGHGIPQGPLPSGMLSEAVLLHLDKAGEQGTRAVYLRYVDDIKILARSEKELRRKLIKLDIASREIGLFPQTSKINIRRILNPDDETKSISRPPEVSVGSKGSQRKIVDRILELSRGGRVDAVHASRVKFLVGRAEPTYRLNARLMQVLSKQPELAPMIARYLSRYRSIPGKLADEVVAYLIEPELYHSVNGEILRATLRNLPASKKQIVGKFAARRLIRPGAGLIPLQPSYKEALIAWVLETKSVTYAEYEEIISGERDWWVKSSSIRSLTPDLFGKPTYSDLLNEFLRASQPAVNLVAAARVLQDGVSLRRPYGDVGEGAKRTLRAAGVIKNVGQPASRINETLGYILRRNVTDYDWKKFFGKGHRHAERMMIFLKRDRETNIDAFLVGLDSYCDYMNREIYRRLKPGSACPPFGHAIKDPALTTALPKMMGMFLVLHALRLESTTAHPSSQKTGAPTRRLKHRDYYKLRPMLLEAFDEFEGAIPS